MFVRNGALTTAWRRTPAAQAASGICCGNVAADLGSTLGFVGDRWQTIDVVTLMLDSTRLEVSLSRTERALAFRKSSVVVERSQIERVQLTADAWTWLRGVPRPGTSIPGVIAAGSWRSSRGEDFVFIRRRALGVVIDLKPAPDAASAAGSESEPLAYKRLVLSTSHGAELIRALALPEHELGEDPLTPVTDLA